MATISTHNGSTVARDHNIRNEKVTSREAHIDPNGIHETWVDEKPHQAYDRIFGEAVNRYNDKQQRADRKITNYYNDVCNDKKKHAVYEMIIGVYPEEGKSLDENTQKAILKEFVDGWKERNPNLELIGAYYHADEEGAPHCHLDYIPVAHGYKNGMETQTGLSQALREMGFGDDKETRKNSPVIRWERRENKSLEDICLAHGLTVEHPKIEGRQHLDTETYKAQKNLERTIDNYIGMENDVKRLEGQRDLVNKQVENALKRKEIALDKSYKRDGDRGFTHNRRLAKDVDAIIKSVKDDVKAIGHTNTDVEARYQEAEEYLIQTTRSADRYAKKTMDEADTIKQNADTYIQNQELYIHMEAERLANERFEKFKSSVKDPDKLEEAINFMSKYNVSGKPLSEIFEKHYEKLQEELEHYWYGR